MLSQTLLSNAIDDNLKYLKDARWDVLTTILDNLHVKHVSTVNTYWDAKCNEMYTTMVYGLSPGKLNEELLKLIETREGGTVELIK